MVARTHRNQGRVVAFQILCNEARGDLLQKPGSGTIRQVPRTEFNDSRNHPLMDAARTPLAVDQQRRGKGGKDCGVQGGPRSACRQFIDRSCEGVGRDNVPREFDWGPKRGDEASRGGCLVPRYGRHYPA